MSLLFISKASRYFPTSSGRFYALKKVSLSFPDKGLVAIKGKSGSGKSTLLNLLSGLDHPNEGKVFFNGSPDLSGRLGHEMAMIFQHYNLIKGQCVLENVLLPLKINGGNRRGALALLRTFGLSRFAKKDIALLSGGEKQRVAICRALASKPKVIFADEPTGALDEKNSEMVMNTLKEVSHHRLVILVSHNEELIDRYADRIIEIRDGRVASDSSPMEVRKSKRPAPKRRHYRSWIMRFILHSVRKHPAKDLVCALAGIVGFSSLILSLGFFTGNEAAIEREQGRALHYLSATVSKESETIVPGSNFKLIKRTRPSKKETLDFLGEIECERIVNDYSFFFPENMVFSVDGKIEKPASFLPIWDLTLEEYGGDLLYQGEAAPDNGFSYCLGNVEFFETYGWEMLGSVLEVSSRFVVDYDGVQNERYVEADLILVGAVKEFGFLNSPRLYYSYQGLEEELAGIEIEGDGGSTDVVSLVEQAEEDAALSSYGWKLFLSGEEQVRSLFRRIDEDAGSIKADSLAYGLRASFLSLSEAFVASLSLFVGIAIAGVALILAMSGFSSLVQGRKDNAILITQGARREDILFLYSGEAMLLCVFSAAISLLISPFLSQIANHFVKNQFDVSGIIDIPFTRFFGVPFLLIWGLVLLACLFGFLSTLVPMMFGIKRNVAEDLRDE